MSTLAIKQFVNKGVFALKKNSPTILVVTGIAVGIAGTVTACRATTKLNDILEETKTNVDLIHKSAEDESLSEEYTENDVKKDLVITYAQTGVKVAKLYAPAVAMGVVSVGCILKSHDILSKRNIALAAAYATVDKSFKEYRTRVVDRFGERVDKELQYGIKAKKITETTVDEETGKEKKVKKTVDTVDRFDATPSMYARFFDKYTRTPDIRDENGNLITKGVVIENLCWKPCGQLNLEFIKIQQSIAQKKLEAEGYLKLNDVYKSLGLPESQAGDVMGWLYDKNDPVLSQTYVDFGIYDHADNFSDFVYDNEGEEAILLDFHVTHNVYNALPKY